MSHYLDGTLQCTEEKHLVEALEDLGFKKEHIEVHANAQTLYDYVGKIRPQKAHIIIRRKHISPSANDIGFEKQANGQYKWWISANEVRHLGYDQKWINKLQARYGLFQAKAMARQRGIRVMEKRVGTKLILEVG